jgi:hypothetical protein
VSGQEFSSKEKFVLGVRNSKELQNILLKKIAEKDA